MNLLNKDLNKLIRLRQSRWKTLIIWLIYLNFIQFTLRFALMGTRIHNEYFQSFSNGPFFDLFFNVDQFNEVFLALSLFPLYCCHIVNEMVNNSDIRMWHPLMTTLTRDNWNQFVEDNLDFTPTFSLIEWLKHPIGNFQKWKIVFSKLRNYRRVCFVHKLKLFPYLNKKIRVKILFPFLISLLILEFIYYSSCKFYT